MLLIFRVSWCQSIHSFFRLSAFVEFLADCDSKSFCFWYVLARSISQFFFHLHWLWLLCAYTNLIIFLSLRHTRIVCILRHFQPPFFFYSVSLAFSFLSTVLLKHISVISLACNVLISIMWGSLRIHYSCHFCS